MPIKEVFKNFIENPTKRARGYHAGDRPVRERLEQDFASDRAENQEMYVFSFENCTRACALRRAVLEIVAVCALEV
jgi:hypothetical protein